MRIENLIPNKDEKHSTLEELCDAIVKKFEIYEITGKPAKYTNETIFRIDLDKDYITIDKSSIIQGIELLKWLRVRDINNHVVLTSFLPIIYWLKKNPKNAIVGSKGTTFVQLPDENLKNDTDKNIIRYDFKIKMDKDNRAVLPELVSKNEINQLLRLDINYEKIKHESVNWWAQKKMLDVYNKLSPCNTHSIKLNIPTSDLTWTIFERLYFSELDENISNRKEHERGQKKIIEDIQDTKNKFSSPKDYPINIIVIDDQKEWASIFSQVLFDNATTTYSVAEVGDLAKIDDVGEIIKKIETISDVNEDKKIIEDSNALNIILLDINLCENDIGKPSIETSGYTILKQLKEKYPEIPVMITTASNKTEKYQKFIELGADTYWIKGKINQENENIDLYENYLDLIFKIYKITSKAYVYFKKLVLLVKEIDNGKVSYWWTNNKTKWLDGTIIKVDDKKMLSAILNNCLIIYKTYLCDYYFNYLENTERQSIYLSNIINKLARVYEIIHNFKGGDEFSGDTNDAKTIKGDYLIDKLKGFGNPASHSFGTFNYKLDNFYDLVDAVEKYLKKDNLYIIDEFVDPLRIEVDRKNKKKKYTLILKDKDDNEYALSGGLSYFGKIIRVYNANKKEKIKIQFIENIFDIDTKSIFFKITDKNYDEETLAKIDIETQLYLSIPFTIDIKNLHFDYFYEDENIFMITNKEDMNRLNKKQVVIQKTINERPVYSFIPYENESIV